MDGILKGEENLKYKRIKQGKAYKFLSPNQKETLHVIKTAHTDFGEDMYFVVHEDQQMMKNGECNFMNAQSIKDKFGIELRKDVPRPE